MPRASPSLRLTPRDFDILDDLGSYRFLSVPQLTALHFGSPSTADGRLRQLHEAGLVVRVFMPVRPFDRSSTTIYALGARGAILLAERHEGIRPRYLSDRDRRSALFLDHTLRRNDVRICLELLDRSLPGFHLLTWKQAPEAVRGVARIPGTGAVQIRVPLVPDGFFAFRMRGVVTAYCLEVDMGTVNTERMLTRYRGYQAWWREGGAARKFGPAPLRVLTMTTTPNRLTTLRRLGRMAQPRGTRSGLHWFSLLSIADLARPVRLLREGWLTASGDAEATRLLVDF